jgi:hypothetical protein
MQQGAAQMADGKLTTYEEFWPFYLREHAKPLSRVLHYIGTTGVIALTVLAIYTQNWAILWLTPIFGYGFAWVAHFFVEHNKPATFTHPLWSFISDFRMYWLFLTRSLKPHLAASGVAPIK